MKVIVEKREILGTLSTLVGRFSLLDLDPRRYISIVGNLSGTNSLSFHVVDDEGFDNWIVFHGDFVIIPAMVPTVVDVKRVLYGEEAQAFSVPVSESVE